MESIKIESGVKSYNITDQNGNPVGTFCFNPADTGLIERHTEVLKHFLQMKNEIQEKKIDPELFVELQDRAVNELVYFVGNDSVKVFFKIMGAFSLQGGQFYYEKVLDIIAGLIKKEAVDNKVFKNRIKKFIK